MSDQVTETIIYTTEYQVVRVYPDGRREPIEGANGNAEHVIMVLNVLVGDGAGPYPYLYAIDKIEPQSQAAPAECAGACEGDFGFPL